MGVVEYPARTWRVRTWIRILTVLQSFGWISLTWFLGFGGDEVDWSIIAWVVFVTVPPFLALYPGVKLRADGELLLRGWTSRRRANAGQVRRLAMTRFGLKLTFDDDTSYTTVIFQATRSFGRPRVLDFVDALRRDPGGSESFHPLDLFQVRELEIFRREDLNP